MAEMLAIIMKNCSIVDLISTEKTLLVEDKLIDHMGMELLYLRTKTWTNLMKC